MRIQREFDKRIARLIGRKIASHREYLGLSVVQCAKDASVSRQQWGYWERNGARHISSLYLCSKTLGITVSELVSVMDGDSLTLPAVAPGRIVEGV